MGCSRLPVWVRCHATMMPFPNATLPVLTSKHAARASTCCRPNGGRASRLGVAATTPACAVCRRGGGGCACVSTCACVSNRAHAFLPSFLPTRVSHHCRMLSRPRPHTRRRRPLPRARALAPHALGVVVCRRGDGADPATVCVFSIAVLLARVRAPGPGPADAVLDADATVNARPRARPHAPHTPTYHAHASRR